MAGLPDDRVTIPDRLIRRRTRPAAGYRSDQMGILHGSFSRLYLSLLPGLCRIYDLPSGPRDLVFYAAGHIGSPYGKFIFVLCSHQRISNLLLWLRPHGDESRLHPDQYLYHFHGDRPLRSVASGSRHPLLYRAGHQLVSNPEEIMAS